MKFTELSDYPVPAGTVTIWTPTADPAGWEADARPFTYDQVALARRSARQPDSENCWLGSIFDVPTAYDPQLLRRTLRRWLSRHDAFLSTFDLAAPDPLSARHTYRGEQLDVTEDVVGTFTSGDDVCALLTEVFGTRLAPTRWPHCLVATIETQPSITGSTGFALVFAADHMVMDAYSIMLCINELQVLYTGLGRGFPVELPTVGSHLDFSAHDRAVGQTLTGDHPAVTGWRNFLSRSEDYPEFGLPLVRPHLETGDRGAPQPQHGLSEYVADDHEATFLSSLARATGHSTQTAVFAALALAYRELSGLEVLRVTVPMHTRHEACYAGSVGWYVGLAPLEVDLSAATTFDDALAATADGIEAVRHLPAFPYQRIAELLDAPVEPEFVVSYLDIRHVPGSADWADARAQILRGTSRSDREVYLWIARVPDGITLSARFPGHDPADESLRTFVDTYSSILRAVVSDGTSLPLDVYTRTAYAGESTFDDARPA